MRLNWLSLLPILLVLLVLAMSYTVLIEPAGKPKISKEEALQIARTQYPDMSMQNSSATPGTYKLSGEERLAWYVDVKTVPDINSPDVYIAVVNAGEPGYAVSWDAIVIVDAMTGEILSLSCEC
jgi:hypothetical protein